MTLTEKQLKKFRLGRSEKDLEKYGLMDAKLKEKIKDEKDK